MTLLIGLAIAVLVGVMLYRQFSSPTQGRPQAAVADTREVAFVARGELFTRRGDGEPIQFESPYVREAYERRERTREQHSWKDGTSFRIRSGGRMGGEAPPDAPISMSCVHLAVSGDLFYAVSDTSVGGLFCREAATGKEHRLMLKPGLNIQDLTLSPDGQQFVASVEQKQGITHIALIDRNGNTLRFISGGDTIDSAPTWIPSAPTQLLFQSTALGRNSQGYVLARGPASIQKLDMTSNSVTPILDDPKFDHLRPRVSMNGDLLYIRRPYVENPYKPENALLDALLMPFAWRVPCSIT